MYSKSTNNLFLPERTTFYKNGITCGYRENGGKIHIMEHTLPNPVVIIRSQGYRYWEKHFRSLPSYCLPELLEKAVQLPNDDLVIVAYDGHVAWR